MLRLLSQCDRQARSKPPAVYARRLGPTLVNPNQVRVTLNK